MDFFRNPRAAGFGSAGAHPLVTRTAPTPIPKPQPIPAQQVPTPRPFPAQQQQQQASQAGLHPSTLLLEKNLFRSWEMNDQDKKMAQQYINWNTQQGRDDWTSGAFNDYLKQGIEPPPQLKEYFKSQKMDYDEVKTPTTEWASLPDDAKAGLLTAYYEGKQLNPWQQKTVARMIRQEEEDAKNLPAPGGDKTPAHLRWLQEFYKQNASKYKMPEKLQEQFVANKLVEEPPAYTLNPAYTKYLEEMKASGLSLDDPSQWSERQEWYKTHPRPSKYLWGKEKTPGWVSPEAEKVAWAQNAKANEAPAAAAPASAAAQPAPAAAQPALRTQSPGAAGQGTFTAQGPGGFTETFGQPEKPLLPDRAATEKRWQEFKAVVYRGLKEGKSPEQIADQIVPQDYPKTGDSMNDLQRGMDLTQKRIAIMGQIERIRKEMATASPVVPGVKNLAPPGPPVASSAAPPIDTTQIGWTSQFGAPPSPTSPSPQPIAAQPSPVAQKQRQSSPAATIEALKNRKGAIISLLSAGQTPEKILEGAFPDINPQDRPYVLKQIKMLQRSRQGPMAISESLGASPSVAVQPSPVEYTPGFEKAYSAYETRQTPSPVSGYSVSGGVPYPYTSAGSGGIGGAPVQRKTSLDGQPSLTPPSPVKKKSKTMQFLSQRPSIWPTTTAYIRRSGTYVGGKKRALRGKPSVSSEMKRIVGESTWNKAMGGK